MGPFETLTPRRHMLRLAFLVSLSLTAFHRERFSARSVRGLADLTVAYPGVGEPPHRACQTASVQLMPPNLGTPTRVPHLPRFWRLAQIWATRNDALRTRAARYDQRLEARACKGPLPIAR